MPRTVETEDLTKHTFHLYSGDYKKLGEYYPDIPPAVLIRRLVRKFLTDIDSRKTPISEMEPVDL